MYEKEALMAVGAGAGGIAQTYVCQLYLDVDSTGAPVNWVPSFGEFGRPSVLLGIVTGGGMLTAGLISMKKGKPFRSGRTQFAAMAYGATALSGAIAGGLGYRVVAPPVAAGMHRVPAGMHRPPARPVQHRQQQVMRPAQPQIREYIL
jgi:hypothetical protein